MRADKQAGGTHPVRIDCAEALADLLILDGAFTIVAHGPHPLQALLAPGVYLAKARVGDDESVQSFVVDEAGKPDLVQLARPRFSSPLPDSWGWREQESVAASFAGIDQIVPYDADVGAVVELLLQCAQPDAAPAPTPAPAPTLLRMSDDAPAAPLSASGQRVDETTLVHAWRLPAGQYLLAWPAPKASPGRQATLRCPVTLLPGMRLLCFVALRAGADGVWQADLDDMAIYYVPMAATRIAGADLIATEVLRKGLREGRLYAQTEALRTLALRPNAGLMGKLYAAHVLAAELDRTGDALRTLVGQLDALMRPFDADVLALRSALGMDVLAQVDTLPILARSWQLLTTALLARPDAGDSAALASLRHDFVGAGTFLRWEHQPGTALNAALAHIARLKLFDDKREMLTSLLNQVDALRHGGTEAVQLSGEQAAAAVAQTLERILAHPQYQIAVKAVLRSPMLSKLLAGPALDLALSLRAGVSGPLAPVFDAAYVLMLQQRLRIPMATLAKAVRLLESILKKETN